MILTPEQIAGILKNNPNKDLLNKAKDVNKELRMHMYGENLATQLQKIDGFEQPTLQKLRVKYARSNEDLMARLGRPIDKVYSAKGGSMYLNLTEAQDKIAKSLLTDVVDGFSVAKWIENFWTPHFKDDPNGIIFMEMAPMQKALKLKAQGKSFVYPTYKSITSVFDYMPKGAQLEYIVFTVTTKEKQNAGIDPALNIFRVVDDAYDYWVNYHDDTVSILNELSFPNFFGAVPGILNSDTPDPSQDGLMLSPFKEVIKLANEFLLYGSIRKTHNFLHGFPKYWEYADDCPKCHGTTFFDSKECPDCRGTGKKLMLSVSDAKLLSYPQTKEDVVIAPHVAGYVSPDKTYWEISTSDLSDLENAATYTLWATTSKVQVQGSGINQRAETKTATEVMDEIKPQADRLWPISDSAAKRMKFIIDAIIKVNLMPAYDGCTLTKGKRYMIEGPDVMKANYEDGIAKGVAPEMLDTLYLAYLEAEYQSDEVKLHIETKKFRIKPLFHSKAADVEASLFVTELDKVGNRYFADFVKEKLNDALILITPEDALRTMLKAYCQEKKASFPVPVEPVLKAA